MRIHLNVTATTAPFVDTKTLPARSGGYIIKGFLINSDTSIATIKIIDDIGDVTPVDGFINAVGDYTSGVMDFNEEASGDINITLEGEGAKATVYYTYGQVQAVL